MKKNRKACKRRGIVLLALAVTRDYSYLRLISSTITKSASHSFLQVPFLVHMITQVTTTITRQRNITYLTVIALRLMVTHLWTKVKLVTRIWTRVQWSLCTSKCETCRLQMRTSYPRKKRNRFICKRTLCWTSWREAWWLTGCLWHNDGQSWRLQGPRVWWIRTEWLSASEMPKYMSCYLPSCRGSIQYVRVINAKKHLSVENDVVAAAENGVPAHFVPRSLEHERKAHGNIFHA